jgi:hypothetical protein
MQMNFNRETEVKRLFSRPRLRWEDNIKIDGVDYVHLIEDGVQWRTLLNTVTKLQVP